MRVLLERHRIDEYNMLEVLRIFFQISAIPREFLYERSVQMNFL